MGQHTESRAATSTIDLSHQEVQRVIEEVETIYKMGRTEWVPAEGITNYLCMVLGYEDVSELEDAIHGTIDEFLRLVPHFETRMMVPEERKLTGMGDDGEGNTNEASTQDGNTSSSTTTTTTASGGAVGTTTTTTTSGQTNSSSSDPIGVPTSTAPRDPSRTHDEHSTSEGRNDSTDDDEVVQKRLRVGDEAPQPKPTLHFRVLPEPPKDQWVCTRLDYPITNRSQLFNGLLKSQYARIEIPCLEFDIAADGNKRTNTVYHWISDAALNLGAEINRTSTELSESDQAKVTNVIQQLGNLLDVDQPWTLVVIDPSGISRFSDMSQVQVTRNYTDTGSCAE